MLASPRLTDRPQIFQLVIANYVAHAQGNNLCGGAKKVCDRACGCVSPEEKLLDLGMGKLIATFESLMHCQDI